jgi:colanic acid/amylovoran biosynthesis protein
MDEVALVFARDRSSLEHLEPFRGRGAAIDTAPDFTVGVKARLPEGFEPRPGLVALIPNRRMVDKAAAASAQQYVDFLAGCAAHVARRGMQPLLVVHDTGLDRELAEAVRRQAGAGAEVLVEPDPRALKGVLGACRLVVASRYHALVGALVQGVPALATGWSHKYGELFEDFGCPDALVEVTAPAAEVAARLDALLDGPERERVIANLRRAAADYARRTEAMWARVAAAIGVPGAAPAPAAVGDEAGARPVAVGAR